MRVFDQGAFKRVLVYRAEVEAFRERWPCSSLPDRAVSFTFQVSNGDLVDMEPSDMDGPDVLALSQDARGAAGLRVMNG